MAGVIKQLQNFLKTTNIFPATLTKAVYDESGKRLDVSLNEINNSLTNVEDKLSSVNLTTLSPSISGYSGSVNYLVKNGFCQIAFNFTCTTPASTPILLTTLPKPLNISMNYHGWIHCWADYTKTPIGYYINPNGEMYIKGGVAGVSFVGTLTYPTFS